MEFHQFAVKKFYGRVLFDIFCIECCFTPGVEPAVLPAADSDAEDVDIQEFGLFKCGQAHARCIQTEDSANTYGESLPFSGASEQLIPGKPILKLLSGGLPQGLGGRRVTS